MTFYHRWDIFWHFPILTYQSWDLTKGQYKNSSQNFTFVNDGHAWSLAIDLKAQSLSNNLDLICKFLIIYMFCLIFYVVLSKRYLGKNYMSTACIWPIKKKYISKFYSFLFLFFKNSLPKKVIYLTTRFNSFSFLI